MVAKTINGNIFKILDKIRNANINAIININIK